jgi:hypothetical protein
VSPGSSGQPTRPQSPSESPGQRDRGPWREVRRPPRSRRRLCVRHAGALPSSCRPKLGGALKASHPPPRTRRHNLRKGPWRSTKRTDVRAIPVRCADFTYEQSGQPSQTPALFWYEPSMSYWHVWSHLKGLYGGLHFTLALLPTRSAYDVDEVPAPRSRPTTVSGQAGERGAKML